MSLPTGQVVWAAEPGRGSVMGRIAVEEAHGRAGYVIRVDGVVVGRSRDVERALSFARRIEADPVCGVRLREQGRARAVRVRCKPPLPGADAGALGSGHRKLKE